MALATLEAKTELREVGQFDNALNRLNGEASRLRDMAETAERIADYLIGSEPQPVGDQVRADKAASHCVGQIHALADDIDESASRLAAALARIGKF
jgi:hypothetical protein